MHLEDWVLVVLYGGSIRTARDQTAHTQDARHLVRVKPSAAPTPPRANPRAKESNDTLGHSKTKQEQKIHKTTTH